MRLFQHCSNNQHTTLDTLTSELVLWECEGSDSQQGREEEDELHVDCAHGALKVDCNVVYAIRCK